MQRNQLLCPNGGHQTNYVFKGTILTRLLQPQQGVHLRR